MEDPILDWGPWGRSLYSIIPVIHFEWASKHVAIAQLRVFVALFSYRVLHLPRRKWCYDKIERTSYMWPRIRAIQTFAPPKYAPEVRSISKIAKLQPSFLVENNLLCESAALLRYKHKCRNFIECVHIRLYTFIYKHFYSLKELEYSKEKQRIINLRKNYKREG